MTGLKLILDCSIHLELSSTTLLNNLSINDQIQGIRLYIESNMKSSLPVSTEHVKKGMQSLGTTFREKSSRSYQVKTKCITGHFLHTLCISGHFALISINYAKYNQHRKWVYLIIINKISLVQWNWRLEHVLSGT